MRFDGSELPATDTEKPIKSAAEQLNVLNEFFKCEVVHELFKGLREDDENFEFVLMAGSPVQELLLQREGYIGEARARKAIRLKLLEMRETLLQQLNQESQ